MPLTIGACLGADASGSITRSKRAGDNGQPCLVPLSTVKGDEGMPPSLTWAVG